MRLKKITDFLPVEDAGVGPMSALMTASILAATVIGGILLTPGTSHATHCNGPGHSDSYQHGSECLNKTHSDGCTPDFYHTNVCC